MRLPVLAFILPLFCAAAEIPQGSHVLLKMVNSITTRTAKEGDYIAGLAPASALAWAVVSVSRL